MNARRGQIVSGWWRTDSPGNVHRALTVVFIRTLQYKWNLLLRLWLRNQTAIWMHSHHRLQVSFVKGREEGNLTKSKYRFLFNFSLKSKNCTLWSCYMWSWLSFFLLKLKFLSYKISSIYETQEYMWNWHFYFIYGKKSMSKLNIPLQPQQKENLLLNPLCWDINQPSLSNPILCFSMFNFG